MNVISLKKLRAFWSAQRDAEVPLRNWHNACRKAHWQNLDEVQTVYPHADTVGDCTVFNIGGNKYRLVVKMRYRLQRIYVTHVLTHREYNKGSWKDDC